MRADWSSARAGRALARIRSAIGATERADGLEIVPTSQQPIRDVALDLSGRDAEALGDLLLRQPVHLLQHEGAARMLRQPADSATENHETLVGRAMRLGRLGCQLP